MNRRSPNVAFIEADTDTHQAMLDRVFFALSDPIRRDILQRLGEQALLVSEVAAAYEISLQAVSKQVQVLVRAGLVSQERSGRISRCSLEIGPLYSAAVWINGYSKYWQAQFDALKHWLQRNGAQPRLAAAKKPKQTRKRKRA